MHSPSKMLDSKHHFSEEAQYPSAGNPSRLRRRRSGKMENSNDEKEADEIMFSRFAVGDLVQVRGFVYLYDGLWT